MTARSRNIRLKPLKADTDDGSHHGAAVGCVKEVLDPVEEQNRKVNTRDESLNGMTA